MTEEVTELKEVSQTLKAVARQLEALAAQLEQASPEERSRIEAEVTRTLETLRGGPSETAKDEAPAQETAAESERLQQEVLRELARGGPAVPLELAAALLAPPDRLQAVLGEMQTTGLVEVRSMPEGNLIRLTPQGRAIAKRLGLV